MGISMGEKFKSHSHCERFTAKQSLFSLVIRLSRCTGCRTTALRLPIDIVVRDPRNDGSFSFLLSSTQTREIDRSKPSQSETIIIPSPIKLLNENLVESERSFNLATTRSDFACVLPHQEYKFAASRSAGLSVIFFAQSKKVTNNQRIPKPKLGHEENPPGHPRIRGDLSLICSKIPVELIRFFLVSFMLACEIDRDEHCRIKPMIHPSQF
jgi:hypothetical protein